MVRVILQQCPEYLTKTCSELSQVAENAARCNEALDMTKYSSKAIREHLLRLAAVSSIHGDTGQEIDPPYGVASGRYDDVVMTGV